MVILIVLSQVLESDIFAARIGRIGKAMFSQVSVRSHPRGVPLSQVLSQVSGPSSFPGAYPSPSPGVSCKPPHFHSHKCLGMLSRLAHKMVHLGAHPLMSIEILKSTGAVVVTVSL